MQCKKSEEQTTVPQPVERAQGNPADMTPPEINELLDKFPTVNTPLDQFLLPNGQSITAFETEYKKKWKTAGGGRLQAPVFTPTEEKYYLIAAISRVAFKLCDKANFQIKKGEKDNEPAQDGLAYVFGGKRYDVRSAASPPIDGLPPNDCKSKACSNLLQGLDCSGFIDNLLKEAKEVSDKEIPDKNYFSSITGVDANTYGTTEHWMTKVLNQNTKLTKIKMVNKKQLSADKLQSGDILSYKGHIAIVLVNPLTKRVNILGANGVTNDDNCGKLKNGKPVSDQCRTNYTEPGQKVPSTRGVRQAEAISTELDNYGDKTYKVLRLVAEGETEEPEQTISEVIPRGTLNFEHYCTAYYNPVTSPIPGNFQTEYRFTAHFGDEYKSFPYRYLYLITPDEQKFFVIPFSPSGDNDLAKIITYETVKAFSAASIDDFTSKNLASTDFKPRENPGVYKFRIILSNKDINQGSALTVSKSPKTISFPQPIFQFKETFPCTLETSTIPVNGGYIKGKGETGSFSVKFE
ncbi:hypothetical protein [Spirosoma harenae]